MPVVLKIKHVRVKLQGLNALRQTIDTKSKDPLERIEQYMMGRIHRNFEQRGRLFQPGGWRPLTQSTEIIKAAGKGIGAGRSMQKSRFSTKIVQFESIPLVRTGQMLSAFYSNIVKRSDGWWRLTVANPTPYFSKHQSANISSRFVTNLAGKKVPLPRRVMLRIMGADRAQMIGIYRRWLNRNIKKTKKTKAT